MTGKLVKRLLLLASAVALLSYSTVCAYMWETQRDQIFEPGARLRTTPDRIGLKFEEVHIPSGSGSKRGDLDGWWIPGDRKDAPTLLYLHGNDENMSHVHDLDNAALMHGMGYNVLMIDYRGYGKSTGGRPSETKVYEDAEAAWNYLLKQRNCASRRTFIYGHSLGGAVAINLAIHHPEAAGLIAESSFTSMVDMAKSRYEYLPVDLLLNQRFDSLGKVGALKIPVLFIHGTWDRTVPYGMSRQLYESSPEPKYLKLIEGGAHNDIGRIAQVEYCDAFSAFVRKYAR